MVPLAPPFPHMFYICANLREKYEWYFPARHVVDIAAVTEKGWIGDLLIRYGHYIVPISHIDKGGLGIAA